MSTAIQNQRLFYINSDHLSLLYVCLNNLCNAGINTRSRLQSPAAFTLYSSRVTSISDPASFPRPVHPSSNPHNEQRPITRRNGSARNDWPLTLPSLFPPANSNCDEGYNDAISRLIPIAIRNTMFALEVNTPKAAYYGGVSLAKCGFESVNWCYVSMIQTLWRKVKSGKDGGVFQSWGETSKKREECLSPTRNTRGIQSRGCIPRSFKSLQSTLFTITKFRYTLIIGQIRVRGQKNVRGERGVTPGSFAH